LQVTTKNLESFLSEIQAGSEETVSLLAVEGGRPTNMQSLLNSFPSDLKTPVILGVGVFPHGDFTSNARELFMTHIELDPEVMMAWHVCTEVVWCYSLKHEIASFRYKEQ
jgi:rRNA pseudouridine-1189 N-methylase Emg1 (Nep1/Mra1 family)